jgi:hypothetical protein
VVDEKLPGLTAPPSVQVVDLQMKEMKVALKLCCRLEPMMAGWEKGQKASVADSEFHIAEYDDSEDHCNGLQV